MESSNNILERYLARPDAYRNHTQVDCFVEASLKSNSVVLFECSPGDILTVNRQILMKAQ